MLENDEESDDGSSDGVSEDSASSDEEEEELSAIPPNPVSFPLRRRREIQITAVEVNGSREVTIDGFGWNNERRTLSQTCLVSLNWPLEKCVSSVLQNFSAAVDIILDSSSLNVRILSSSCSSYGYWGCQWLRCVMCVSCEELSFIYLFFVVTERIHATYVSICRTLPPHIVINKLTICIQNRFVVDTRTCDCLGWFPNSTHWNIPPRVYASDDKRRMLGEFASYLLERTCRCGNSESSAKRRGAALVGITVVEVGEGV